MKKEVIREEKLLHKAKMKKEQPMDVELKVDDQKEKCKENGEKTPEETKKDADLLTLEGWSSYC